jgi:DnaJ-class molecular chaperone
MTKLTDIFEDDEIHCLNTPDWWANEISNKISSHAAGILYNYIAYLETFSPDDDEITTQGYYECADCSGSGAHVYDGEQSDCDRCHGWGKLRLNGQPNAPGGEG